MRGVSEALAMSSSVTMPLPGVESTSDEPAAVTSAVLTLVPGVATTAWTVSVASPPAPIVPTVQVPLAETYKPPGTRWRSRT